MKHSGRTAVVTGAAGFIGSHLVHRLLEAGWAVRAIDLDVPPGRNGGAARDGGVRWIRADVRALADNPRPLAGADAVFHLASAHLQVGASAEWFRSVNVGGAAGVARACGRAGVRRLVHVSSVGVYGHVEAPPADENSPARPDNEYERTKLEGEGAVLRAARDSGVEVVVLRPSWVYGPGCPRTAKLLRTIREGRFAFVGEGANLRHPLFIDDALRAMELAAEAPASALGQRYLIVGPRAVTVRALVDACADAQGVPRPRRRLPRGLVALGAHALELGFGLVGREPPISRRSLLFFENDNAFDGRAAERDLGFCPDVELEEGLRRTITVGPADAAPVEGR